MGSGPIFSRPSRLSYAPRDSESSEHESDNGLVGENDCLICYEPVNDNVRISHRAGEGQHVFHYECIKNYGLSEPGRVAIQDDEGEGGDCYLPCPLCRVNCCSTFNPGQREEFMDELNAGEDVEYETPVLWDDNDRELVQGARLAAQRQQEERLAIRLAQLRREAEQEEQFAGRKRRKTKRTKRTKRSKRSKRKRTNKI